MKPEEEHSNHYSGGYGRFTADSGPRRKSATGLGATRSNRRRKTESRQRSLRISEILSDDISRAARRIENGALGSYQCHHELISRLLRSASELIDDPSGASGATQNVREYLDQFDEVTSSASQTRSNSRKSSVASLQMPTTQQPKMSRSSSCDARGKATQTDSTCLGTLEGFTKTTDGRLPPGGRAEVLISNTTQRDLVFGVYVLLTPKNESNAGECGEMPETSSRKMSTPNLDEKQSTGPSPSTETAAPVSSPPTKPDPSAGDNLAPNVPSSGDDNKSNTECDTRQFVPPAAPLLEVNVDSARDKVIKAREEALEHLRKIDEIIERNKAIRRAERGPPPEQVVALQSPSEEKVQLTKVPENRAGPLEATWKSQSYPPLRRTISGGLIDRDEPQVMVASEEKPGIFEPSRAHVNCTWKLVTKEVIEEGEKMTVQEWVLESESNLRPAYAGPSEQYPGSGYDANDRRPFKVIRIHPGLKPYAYDIANVDMELYGVLKIHMAVKSVTKDTLGGLKIEALKFMRNFKTAHLDALLVAEVVEATIFAAMLPTKGSLRRWKNYVSWTSAARAQKWNENIKTGVVRPRWWQVWRSKKSIYAQNE